MKLSNVPLRARLGVAFGIVCAEVPSVAVLALAPLGKADTNFDGFVRGIRTRTAEAARLRHAVDAPAIAALDLVLVTKKPDNEPETALVKKAHAKVAATLEKPADLAKATDVSEQARDLIAGIHMVEQVEQGTRQVDAASATVAAIGDAFSRVGDIVAAISSAPVEQSAGASQVGEAVSQMGRFTQQRAALIKASGDAAQSLKVQSQHLVKTVATFRLAALT